MLERKYSYRSFVHFAAHLHSLFSLSLHSLPAVDPRDDRARLISTTPVDNPLIDDLLDTKIHFQPVTFGSISATITATFDHPDDPHEART